MKKIWKPIETAPKDGRSILLMDNDQPGCKNGVADKCWCGNTAVAEWWGQVNDGKWIMYMNVPNDPPLHFIPTHWMKLPHPPSKQIKKRRKKR